MTFQRVLDAEAMKSMGKVGGRSRSEAKREAARANQKKAVEAKRLRRLGVQS